MSGVSDTKAVAALQALPNAELGHWPTPLHQLERFGAELGAEIWIKRDDIQGVALAGNKIRKFNLVLGQAVAEGCDTLVTTGAVQSNSARTGASAAAALGLDAILLLEGDEPPEALANLLLDRLVGAEVRFAGDVSWKALNDGVDSIVAELAASGRKGYAAPVGCSTPLGSLGFALAFLELEEQLIQAGVTPSALVHTSTSGGTHAGLLAGRSMAGSSMRIIGVDAGFGYSDPDVELHRLAAKTAAVVGHDLNLDVSQMEVATNYIGQGYAKPNPAANDAIKLLSSTEAILTDPVYSGKGLAGLVDMVTKGELQGPVVFWHTGGYHALFDPEFGSTLT